MSSHLSRAVVLAALVLAGCGSSSSGDCTTGICAFVPTSGEVSGWTRDGSLRVLIDSPTIILGGPSGGLDGAAEPFHEAGLVQVALQDFMYNSIKTTLRIWELTSVTTATTAYDDTRTGGGTGVSVTIGDADAARIISDVTIKVNVRKGVYFIFAEINSNTAEANTQVQALVSAIEHKM